MTRGSGRVGSTRLAVALTCAASVVAASMWATTAAADIAGDPSAPVPSPHPALAPWRRPRHQVNQPTLTNCFGIGIDLGAGRG